MKLWSLDLIRVNDLITVCREPSCIRASILLAWRCFCRFKELWLLRSTSFSESESEKIFALLAAVRLRNVSLSESGGDGGVTLGGTLTLPFGGRTPLTMAPINGCFGLQTVVPGGNFFLRQLGLP